VSDVSIPIPALDFSRLRSLGPFLASQRRTVIAETVVPPAILPNGESAGADSKAPAESQQEAEYDERQPLLDGVSGTNEEKAPGLSTIGEM
jgi:hypothetical protein